MFDVMKLEFGRAVTRRKSKAVFKKANNDQGDDWALAKPGLRLRCRKVSLASSKEGNELQELVCTTTDVPVRLPLPSTLLPFFLFPKHTIIARQPQRAE